VKLNKRKLIRKSIPDEEKPLNERQELFCQEYVNQEIPNASEAYRKAGYAATSSVAVCARGLLRLPQVIRRIRELRQDRIRRLETSGDEVVRRLLLLASSNIKDYLDYDGYSIRIKPSDDLSREQAFCINEIKEKVARDGSRSLEFKLHDKKPALALLAQHFGLLDGSAGAQDPAEKAKEFKNHLDSLLNSVPLEPEEEFER
jgi:phage terminase small subunit